MSSTEWEDLVPLEIYDNNGDVYRTYTTQREKNSTEVSAAMTLRLLQKLKASGQKPFSKWDVSLGAGNDADCSEWLPAGPAGRKKAAVTSKSCGAIPKTVGAPGPCNIGDKPKRATGKTGAVWPQYKTKVLLKTCLPYAEQLRCSAVPDTFWQHISDVLFAMDSHGLNYSSQQLREKMRTLKGYFNNTKSGKFRGSSWEFFSLMEDLFDKPIQGDLTNLGDSNPSISHSVDLNAINYKERAAVSTNVPKVADINFSVHVPSTSGCESFSLKDSDHVKKGNLVSALDFTTIPEGTVINCDVLGLNVPSISGWDSVVDGSLTDSDTISRNVCSVSAGASKIVIEARDFNYNDSCLNVPSISGLESAVNGSLLDSDTVRNVIPVSARESKIVPEARDINYNVYGLNVPSKMLPDLGFEKEQHTDSNMISDMANVSEELGVEFLDKQADMDYCGMQTIDSSDSDLDIDIVNLSMSPKSSSALANNGTAARLIPFAIAHNNIRSTLGENVVGPKAFSLGTKTLKTEIGSQSTLVVGSVVEGHDTTSYSNFDCTGMLSSTPTKRTSSSLKTCGSPAAKTFGSPTFKTFRSPPSKKTGSGRAVYSPNKTKTPRTPKRRIGAVHLVWESVVIETFMNACLSHKDDLQKESIPISFWKKMSEELLSLGHDKSWEVIRAKFENMNNYFSRALECGGKQGGIQWPHFKKFCKIYDLDCETEDIIETESESRKLWTENRERLLITLYSEKKTSFDATKCPIRHSILYHQIAATMNMHDVPVTGTQCKAHMKLLIKDFNKAYDGRGTGTGALEFQYFEEFLLIFKGSPSLEPPVCLSVGRGLSMTIEGKTVVEPTPHSRTRQKTDKDKKPNNKGTYNYKSAVTPRASGTQDRLADEVKRMTDIYDQKSDAKLDLFRQLVSNFQFKK